MELLAENLTKLGANNISSYGKLISCGLKGKEINIYIAERDFYHLYINGEYLWVTDDIITLTNYLKSSNSSKL